MNPKRLHQILHVVELVGAVLFLACSFSAVGRSIGGVAMGSVSPAIVPEDDDDEAMDYMKTGICLPTSVATPSQG